MKVFISWSGERSRQVADRLRKWIPLIVQSIEPWMSDVDIDPGRRWSQALAEQLEHSNVGLICLTRENLANPWMLFEAGALAKSTERGRLIPICIGVDDVEIPSPLAMFQAVPLTKEGIRNLMRNLSIADEESKLDGSSLDTLFEMMWPKIEIELRTAQEAAKQIASAIESRSDREILEELLSLSKASRQTTKKDIVETLSALEKRLRASAQEANEAFTKYDAPTGLVADRLEEDADEISTALKTVERIMPL